MTAMYLFNKYTKWYYNIISKAQSRNDILDYTEKHHIIPKSLGGSNDKLNLVKLTPREHFICHLLLTRMLEGRLKAKMVYAVMLLRHSPFHTGYNVNSRLYETMRNELSVAQSNRVITDEYRKNCSAARKGIKLSDDHKQKIGDIHRGKIMSLESRLKMSNSRKGKSMPDDIKLKLSLKKKGIPGHACSSLKKENMSTIGKTRRWVNNGSVQYFTPEHKNFIDIGFIYGRLSWI